LALIFSLAPPASNSVAAQGNPRPAPLTPVQAEFEKLTQLHSIAPTRDLLEIEKIRREIEKAGLEIGKLQEENGSGRWIPVAAIVASFLAGLIGAGVSLFVARLQKKQSLDQATHEKRLECYPHLTKAMAKLALFFPRTNPGGADQIDRNECLNIGRAMSDWYFNTGGLLLSTNARDAYFLLMRCLAKASDSDGTKPLKTPRFDQYAERVSDTKMDVYRMMLGLDANSSALRWFWRFRQESPVMKVVLGKRKKRETKDDGLEITWRFGDELANAEVAEAKRRLDEYFDKKTDDKSAQNAALCLIVKDLKDYVLLQTLSSRLRTALADDISSRRRPA
jgi:hypothetical protein